MEGRIERALREMSERHHSDMQMMSDRYAQGLQMIADRHQSETRAQTRWLIGIGVAGIGLLIGLLARLV